MTYSTSFRGSSSLATGETIIDEASPNVASGVEATTSQAPTSKLDTSSTFVHLSVQLPATRIQAGTFSELLVYSSVTRDLYV